MWLAGAVWLLILPIVATGAIGLGMPVAVAIGAGAVTAAVIAWSVAAALTTSIGPPLARSRGLRLLAGFCLTAASVQVALLSVFMADVSRVGYSCKPGDPFRVRHSCMSSYAEAARFAEAGTLNIYDVTLYQPRQIGPLNVDPYHYPPPFLLLPQAVRAIAPDFWDFRAVWFAFQALVMVGAFLAAAIWIGGSAGTVTLAGGALALAMPGTTFSLQQGNFQVTATPLAALAFAMILAGRVPVGAGILAWTAAAKIFPGILVVHLAAARRWRALIWVAGLSVVLLGVTLAVQGMRPTRDFITHALPEISSGQAFPHTENPPTARMNWTVYGATVRLRHLGAAAMTQPAGLRIASIYGVILIACAAFAGWLTRFDLSTSAGRVTILLTAVAFVGLASYRSPFAGAPYGSFSTLWLLALLAAAASSLRTAGVWLALLTAYAASVWMLPSPAYPLSVPWLYFSGALFLASVGVNAWAAARSVRLSASAPARADAVSA